MVWVCECVDGWEQCLSCVMKRLYLVLCVCVGSDGGGGLDAPSQDGDLCC